MNSSHSRPFDPSADYPSARYWSRPASTDPDSKSNASGADPDIAGSSSDSAVVCEVCPHQCRIAPGKTGRCQIRLNQGGRLTTPFYGRWTSLAIDPIEKKPLYHFFPASPILSIGTAGCNLTCRFCQNWSISQSAPVPKELSLMTPEDLADLAEKRGTPSVAFTYNEPSVWAEFVIDAAKECRRRGIRTVAVTNGMIRGKAREDFYEVMDAVNIDLKGFTDEFYGGLCGGSLEGVKETIRFAARETGVWLEVTNLIIPTHNDSPDEIARMTDWLAEAVGDEVPLHFSAFFPTHRLTDVPRTSPETLYAAMKIARQSGIRFVYVGNIAGDRGHSTLCPNCGGEIIHRNGFRATSRIVPEFPIPHKESPTHSSAAPPNVPYSFRMTPFEPLVGEYRFVAPGSDRSESDPRQTASNGSARPDDSMNEKMIGRQQASDEKTPDKNKTPRGLCPHCRTVIAGRFF